MNRPDFEEYRRHADIMSLSTEPPVREAASAALETLDYIEHLEARVKELEAANEWQPIETAPEYVRVLITHPKMKDRTDVTSCCARRYQGNWYSPEIWDTEATYSDEDVDPHPTHWRPLPSLPEGA